MATLPQRTRPAQCKPIERWNQPIVIYVTVCTKDRRSFLANDLLHDLLRRAWIAADAWRVGYYMIMPDHVHFFCTPGRMPVYNLKMWLAYWKRIATLSIYDGGLSAFLDKAATVDGDLPRRHGIVWGRDGWDTQVRSFDHYTAKLAYAQANPVRKGLVATSREWRYQGYINDALW
ncbi:hypothetical protein GX586_15315 [bacterium]|nr:hypothetical protein [bacterium]